MGNLLEILHRLWAEYTRDNFRTQVLNASAVISENSGASNRFTYTVPTGQRGRINIAGLFLIGQVAATSSTVTDMAEARLRIVDTSGDNLAVLFAMLHSMSYAAGDRQSDSIGGSGYLDAGDQVIGQDIFDGDAAGAGRMDISMGVAVAEFDAR